MKEYIVKASSKKEAIDKLFEYDFKWRNEAINRNKSGYKLFAKSDFNAVPLEKEFDANGIACLN